MGVNWCSTPNFVSIRWNVLLLYTPPLSLSRTWGTPYTRKTPSSTLLVTAEDVAFRKGKSKEYFVRQSDTTNRNR
uniref:Putative secreted protein n=1 Tax=Panstrongylus lignarius TaxID=156445 RepID=A0A224XX96_9HEMI